MRLTHGLEAPLATYRLQFIGPDGRSDRALELECLDDEHAISVVEEHLSHSGMLLWDGERLVKRFDGAGD